MRALIKCHESIVKTKQYDISLWKLILYTNIIDVKKVGSACLLWNKTHLFSWKLSINIFSQRNNIA